MRDGTISTARKFIPILLVSALGILCVAGSATAQVTLADQNTTIHITTNSSAGMDSWVTDGQSILNQQWFWYRVGPSGGQSSLDTLPSTYTQIDAADIKATFTGADFIVTAKLGLSGSAPGNGTADLSLQFTVQNTSGSTLNFHFFEYSNFTLGGQNIATFVDSNDVFQSGSLGSITEDAAATGGSGFAAPMHYEANVFNSTLTSLTSGSPYVLDQASSSTGNVTWAFEWDLPIAVGKSSQFSKNIVVDVPEPATVGLVAAGLAGLYLVRRRRKS